jgi:arginyl-tRNA synthetase
MNVDMALGAGILVVHAVSIPICVSDACGGMTTAIQALREAVLASARELAGAGEPAGNVVPDSDGERPSVERVSPARRGELEPDAITLERPPRPDFGDYSTNAALLLAPALATAPRELAERLGAELKARMEEGLERFEVAGPGFLNLFVSDAWLSGALAGSLRAGDRIGGDGAPTRERILVEFVSANPTGPMHVGHARNAAYGDSLARLLAFYGHDVEREFYINDAGSQIAKLGESIAALARGEEVPADGYHGEYVQALAAELPGAQTMDAARLGRAAVEVMVARMQASLHAFAVEGFDHWQYESELHAGRPSAVEHALQTLERHGHAYRRDGALWLSTTDYGDDKDRVLVRSSGEHTYFASDIAYHLDKRERGFERQIDVWGADHHGYTARMKAAYAALGGDPGQLELLIMQLVHLVRRGERAQMSKRAGEFVTLDQLLQEIGADAARWFLLSRSHDTTIDLDLDLAREQSSENPVYYVQYAHARIASVLAKAGPARVQAAIEEGGQPAPQGGWDGYRLHASERTLIKKLLAFPGEIAQAAERRAPHRVAAYAHELAQDFTAFYRDCRVVGAEPEHVESLRLALSVVAQRALARSLELLGVSAPAAM